MPFFNLLVQVIIINDSYVLLPFFKPFGQKTKSLCIVFDRPINDVNLFKEKLRLKGGCSSK